MPFECFCIGNIEDSCNSYAFVVVGASAHFWSNYMTGQRKKAHYGHTFQNFTANYNLGCLWAMEMEVCAQQLSRGQLIQYMTH